MDKIAKTYIQRYQKSKAFRERWVPLFEECYEYALPQRESFYSETPGERRDDKIFDETAVVGVQEFASRLQSGIVPNFARWADLMSGSEVPKDQREAIDNELDEVTDYVFEVLQNSNFSQEVHESFMDLAVGTGILCVEEGDAINPVNFSAIPLPHVVLDTGPDDKIDHVYRERKKIKYDQLSELYPNATFDPKVMAQMGKEAETTVLELVCKDYSRKNEDAYFHYAICMNTETLLYSNEISGLGANPFICFRWSKCAGEIYGRGPLINALSAIKTCNLTIELILENAQMAISGVYQIDDALYNDMLGNPDRTPATATEVAERMADLSRRMGSAFGRLQAELVQPLLQRVIYILKKQGRIEVPSVNGREVKIRSVSPLAQAQANQDISSIARFLELVGGVFGPEMLQLLIDGEETAAHLAKKFGVPESLIRDADQRKQLAAMAQQMAQQQQMQQQPQQEAPIG